MAICHFVRHWDVQQLFEAPSDSCVVTHREMETLFGVDNTKDAICSRCSAKQEQEPRTLQILYLRDPLEKSRVLCNFLGEAGLPRKLDAPKGFPKW